MEFASISTLQDWRDLSLLIFTAAGSILFVVSIFFTLITGYLATSTILRTRRILTNNLAPTLDSVRETAESVRGTVGFISDNAVRPVVRVYSVYAGARRFVTVLVRVARPKGTA